MNKYFSPEVEFVEFETEIFMTASCTVHEDCEYVCPDAYGETCTGRPYVGS